MEVEEIGGMFNLVFVYVLFMSGVNKDQFDGLGITRVLTTCFCAWSFFFHYSFGDSGKGGFGGGNKGGQPGSNLQKPVWDMSRLVPFQKNFYRESPAVAARSDVS